ncbi:MAG: hemin receptor [Anaerolineaceae bacterium]|nr:hemin receptor [Anaerolineaceae bacterium]
MDLTTIILVQDSLARLRPERETAVVLFCLRLSELDPHLPEFFSGEVAGHGRQFWSVIEQWVNDLATPQFTIPAVKTLGEFHGRQGIRPFHYHAFGQALLWTLAQLQGEAFTQAVADAWTEAFYLLVGLMKEAASCTPDAPTASHTPPRPPKET